MKCPRYKAAPDESGLMSFVLLDLDATIVLNASPIDGALLDSPVIYRRAGGNHRAGTYHRAGANHHAPNYRAGANHRAGTHHRAGVMVESISIGEALARRRPRGHEVPALQSGAG